MRFWFDTEFIEDGRTIDLISIGVVAEDGREYYAELKDGWDATKASEWVVENVLNHLTQASEHQRTRADVAKDLVAFMGEKPEIWAYYADYDWVALCQLFGTMMDLPKSWPMFCRDLKQLMETEGLNGELPPHEGEHNALNDARWTHKAWRFVLGLPVDQDKAEATNQAGADLMLCGHPQSAISTFNEWGSGIGTSYCRMCEAEAKESHQ